MSLKRVDLIGGLHMLKSPNSKRFVQEDALISPRVSVYSKPLATKETKKIRKTKLIQVHRLKGFHEDLGDVINHKILWEPEFEPTLSEAQTKKQ